ncbi:MAG: hypothetical protein DKM50_08730 [Candidatus Margulisiibacteriota bacterium]|nr:MAG: hypothetical protein A2X43_11715 [Candidatus Margulisbacteria bacterium GWD2_39_127]OGI01807.1 MAG: hypothetical protein A2X42_04240 [Candidatus Margulisbacteria bacterium GWF2_38_17]OGI10129.1 MAG: hypothetical protein A2X41_00960 [Candidatus Margulisbacteria bacterium GWE2_39_32]PZM79534.1 MAG: hypothetical protein DKM50_08730 [Candidatus Margulisiibacteriota bacterium]HAR63793.1 hypothetical protein [Candidatus Margulisiibacteriota bacterium]
MLRENATAIFNIRRIADVLLANASFFVTYYIFDASMSGGYYYKLMQFMHLLIPITIIWWIVLKDRKVYESHRFEPLVTQMAKVIRALLVCNIVFLATITLLKMPLPGRFFFGFFMAINALILILERIIINILSSFVRMKGYNFKNVVIVGVNRVSIELIELIRSHKEWGLNVQGIIVPTLTIEDKEEAKKLKESGLTGEIILGTLEDFNESIKDIVVDIVFFVVPPHHIRKIQPHLKYCVERGIETKLTINYFFDSMDFVKTDLDQLEKIPLLSFETTHFNPYTLLIKEIIDRTFAFIWVIILLPVFLLAALAIRIESKGPILFRQERVGRNGRLFNMYKFRSMGVDAEKQRKELESLNEMSGPVFKITNDPRVTKIGKFLRKTSIDELPQLLNVLKGDMSLVGPRPPLPSEIQQYDNWQRRRLSVKPGITCTWQVSGRNNIDFSEWMKMDLEYIDTWSLTNDFRLLVKTLPAIVKQTGAK